MEGEDEVVIFACFEAPEDESSLIVVFLLLLEPNQSNHKLQSTKTQNSQISIKQFDKCGTHNLR